MNKIGSRKIPHDYFCLDFCQYNLKSSYQNIIEYGRDKKHVDYKYVLIAHIIIRLDILFINFAFQKNFLFIVITKYRNDNNIMIAVAIF